MEELVKLLNTDESSALINVGGIIISLIGFGATIWTLLKTKNAADEARKAVTRVREDMRNIKTVTDFSQSIAIMDEIRRLHREGSWQILPDRYSILKGLLISIRSTNPSLPDKHKVALQNAIQHFTNIESQIERSLESGNSPTNIAKLNTIVSKQMDALREALVEIQATVGE
jgi:hypothetical protein